MGHNSDLTTDTLLLTRLGQMLIMGIPVVTPAVDTETHQFRVHFEYASK
jgi:hypothetical protein